MTYVNALAISAVVLLPTVLTGAIAFNVANGRMFYGFYPLFFVILALAPILPLFVVVVLSMPVVWLGSYFRGKPTLKSVLTILFYVVLMCAYMVVVYYMNTTGFGQNGNVEMSQGMLGSLGTLANVFYPDKALVNFCLGIDAGKNFGISAAITVGMIAIMLLLSSLFYKKSTRESRKAHKRRSPKRVFETKQRRRITDEKGYKIHHAQQLACDDFDCKLAYGADFIVVMYFISNFKANADDSLTPIMAQMMGIGFVVMYSMIFLAGANMIANMAYTREGKSFLQAKRCR